LQMSLPENSLVGVIFPVEGQFAANSNADSIINCSRQIVNCQVGESARSQKGEARL
jgi:hypothetical protein